MGDGKRVIDNQFQTLLRMIRHLYAFAVIVFFVVISLTYYYVILIPRGIADSTSSLSTATSGVEFRGEIVRKWHTKPTRASVQMEGSCKHQPQLSSTSCKRWAITTTIFDVSIAIQQLLSLEGWCVVIVGDKKTPLSMQGMYETHLEHTSVFKYLGVEEQVELANTGCYPLLNQLSWNSFGRKNVGYFYAIMNGAELVWDFDDDNMLLDVSYINMAADMVQSSRFDLKSPIVNPKIHVFNPYVSLGGAHSAHQTAPPIWPRGFPLTQITNPMVGVQGGLLRLKEVVGKSIGVLQSLANHDPDVDAIFRLTRTGRFDFTSKFGRNKFVETPVGTLTPYNAQASLHLALWCLLLPVSVHGRVSDIWRGYACQRLMWDVGQRLVFAPPMVRQDRNRHSWLGDFESELDLYMKTDKLVEFLIRWKAEKNSTLSERMIALWIALYERDYIDADDVVLVKSWVATLRAIRYRFPPIVSGTTASLSSPSLSVRRKKKRKKKAQPSSSVRRKKPRKKKAQPSSSVRRKKPRKKKAPPSSSVRRKKPRKKKAQPSSSVRRKKPRKKKAPPSSSIRRKKKRKKKVPPSSSVRRKKKRKKKVPPSSSVRRKKKRKKKAPSSSVRLKKPRKKKAPPSSSVRRKKPRKKEAQPSSSVRRKKKRKKKVPPSSSVRRKKKRKKKAPSSSVRLKKPRKKKAPPSSSVRRKKPKKAWLPVSSKVSTVLLKYGEYASYFALDILPVLSSGKRSYGVSTYNREGYDLDAGCYLYRTNSTVSVVMEEYGAGVMTRFQIGCGYANDDDNSTAIVVEFDDGVYEVTVGQFCRGLVSPFIAPLCAPVRLPSSGCVCHSAIAFSRHARVYLRGEEKRTNKYYFYVDYTMNSEPTNVILNTNRIDTEFIASEMERVDANIRLGRPPVVDYEIWDSDNTFHETKEIVLEPHISQIVWERHNGGVVRSLSIGIDSSEYTLWDSVLVSIYWDNATEPQVNNVSSAKLFGFPVHREAKRSEVRAFGFGFRGNQRTGYIHLPMPFWNSARIHVMNSHSKSTTTVQVVVHGTNIMSYSREDTGYFCAQISYEAYVPEHMDATYARIYGKGKLIAVHQYASTPGPFADIESLSEERSKNLYKSSPWAHEGDPHFHVDGIRSASLVGTGSEDLFGFAHGFPAFDCHPLYGGLGKHMNATAADGEIAEYWQAYRLFIFDSYVYNTELIAGCAHGDGPMKNFVPMKSITLALFYNMKPQRIIQTMFNISDAHTSRKHSYMAGNDSVLLHMRGRYYGRYDTGFYNYSGMGLLSGSSFTVTIPKKHTGVTLRRLLNYQYCNQKASISVNGVLAGIWLTAGCNYFYPCLEHEFPLPFRLTRGRSKLSITINPVVSSDSTDSTTVIRVNTEYGKRRGNFRQRQRDMWVNQLWTEFAYWVLVDV